ncbi:DUF2294 domain-containing protein [Lusitaniella coriacea LEGE 07157]|uniref:DUF2294 domain-containing protein n=1 Tax=Lusitaniella coriacea LEGE 07157 TaxID=945747 RepID=A0A8J7E143_9CYAN|nr:DUF2294 domain-containing protein [Lusitaniella coriacea]MBE9118467.1 DUF2294 domain-containing protein [Lusitaniella coriacea LEGE 07157]
MKTRLTERIQGLYEQQLQHQLHEVSYKLSDKTLVIVMEGTLTKPEQILMARDRAELAQQVRTVLNSALKPQICQLVEEVMDVRVIDFLSDTTISTGRTGAIAIFEFEQKSKVFSLANSQRG